MCQVFQHHGWADEREFQDTRCSPAEVVRMYGAGTEQLLSDHFSTGSTDLPFPNSTGMWMSAEQLVKPYHQIKALCTHSCLQDCLALGFTGYGSTAYLLHKLKHTHLQMDTPPVSCRVLWNSSSPHTSIVHWVFPKERESRLQYL